MLRPEGGPDAMLSMLDVAIVSGLPKLTHPGR